MIASPVKPDTGVGHRPARDSMPSVVQLSPFGKFKRTAVPTPTSVDTRLLRRQTHFVPVAGCRAENTAKWRLNRRNDEDDDLSPRTSVTTSAAAEQHQSTSRKAVVARKAKAGTKVTVTEMREQQLEKIMADQVAVAQRQIERFKLKPQQAMRVAINPDSIPGLNVEALSKRVLTDQDLEEAAEEPDDELVDSADYEEHHATEVGGSAPADMPEKLGALFVSRIGFGFPSSTIGFGSTQGAGMGRLFAAQCDRYLLLGVVDGHGQPAAAAELEGLVAEQLPSAVFRSPSLVRDGHAPTALKSAFNVVHHLAAKSMVDVRLAGACCTVCLWDSDTVWVAHVGDCRAVLGMPDTKQNALSSHFVPMPLTKDHTMGNGAEYDRVTKAGAEVRNMEGDKGYRLFLRKGDVPGLAVTRAIGDRIAHMVGVSHTPSVSSVARQGLGGGTFLVMASGGVWATMSERHAVNWVGSNFATAAEAADSLSEEALRRWQLPGKRHLAQNVQDCFVSAVVFFGEEPSQDEPAALPFSARNSEEGRLVLPAVPTTPRTFLVGPSAPAVKKAWSEVKSVDRTNVMRRVQAHRQPLEQVFANDGGLAAANEFAATKL